MVPMAVISAGLAHSPHHALSRCSTLQLTERSELLEAPQQAERALRDGNA